MLTLNPGAVVFEVPLMRREGMGYGEGAIRVCSDDARRKEVMGRPYSIPWAERIEGSREEKQALEVAGKKEGRITSTKTVGPLKMPSLMEAGPHRPLVTCPLVLDNGQLHPCSLH